MQDKQTVSHQRVRIETSEAPGAGGDYVSTSAIVTGIVEVYFFLAVNFAAASFMAFCSAFCFAWKALSSSLSSVPSFCKTGAMAQVR